MTKKEKKLRKKLKEIEKRGNMYYNPYMGADNPTPTFDRSASRYINYNAMPNPTNPVINHPWWYQQACPPSLTPLAWAPPCPPPQCQDQQIAPEKTVNREEKLRNEIDNIYYNVFTNPDYIDSAWIVFDNDISVIGLDPTTVSMLTDYNNKNIVLAFAINTLDNARIEDFYEKYLRPEFDGTITNIIMPLIKDNDAAIVTLNAKNPNNNYPMNAREFNFLMRTIAVGIFKNASKEAVTVAKTIGNLATIMSHENYYDIIDNIQTAINYYNEITKDLVDDPEEQDDVRLNPEDVARMVWKLKPLNQDEEKEFIDKMRKVIGGVIPDHLRKIEDTFVVQQENSPEEEDSFTPKDKEQEGFTIHDIDGSVKTKQDKGKYYVYPTLINDPDLLDGYIYAGIRFKKNMTKEYHVNTFIKLRDNIGLDAYWQLEGSDDYYIIRIINKFDVSNQHIKNMINIYNSISENRPDNVFKLLNMMGVRYRSYRAQALHDDECRAVLYPDIEDQAKRNKKIYNSFYNFAIWMKHVGASQEAAK